MTIEEIGSLGELISSLGVMATLVFLVFELRRNTNEAIRSSFDRTFERFSSARRMIANDETLAELVAKIDRDEQLSLSETKRVTGYLNELGLAVNYYYAEYAESKETRIRKSVDVALDEYVKAVDNSFGRNYLQSSHLPDNFRDIVSSRLERNV